MGFPKIGLHLDLRVQVPPLPALRRLAQEAAELGVNTLVMEWEASFPFDRHAVISSSYAYTPEEMREFLEDCKQWGLDVIPLQQCFGHVEYILRHDRYASLREDCTDLCQVCPCRIEEAVTVFSDIFREVSALHESDFFHIGGDETYLLGKCPICRARAEAEGKSKLYVDYFKRIAEEVIRLGKRPLLWVDMLLKHPEAAAEMPRECVFVDWNYGWPVDRFGDFEALSALPFEFWGAVAMRSAPDNHSSHAWVTHLRNLQDYIPTARRMQFQGIIMTSWSTSGVYGYEWEMTGLPLALYPVRRVTPHAGLRVLMAAFAEAVEKDEPLNGTEFLLRYAQERFGLNEADTATFQEAILLSDRSEGCDNLRSNLLGEARKARDLLMSLKPRRHGREFARYALLVALTEFNGRVTQLNGRVQAEGCTLREKEALSQQALALLEEGETLDREFKRLYAGELYPGELEEESRYRLQRIRDLVARICGRSLLGDIADQEHDLETPRILPSPLGVKTAELAILT